MIQYRQRGEAIDFVNATATAIGPMQAVAIGANRIGIVADIIQPGETGAANVIGVFEIPKAAADTYAVGDAVSVDLATQQAASAGQPAGWAVEEAKVGEEYVRVQIGW